MARGLTAVTRVRYEPGETDQYGETGPGVRTEEDLPPALYAPAGSYEPVQAGTAAVISSPSLYWRGHQPDVLASDLLVVDGTTYRVEGQPARWPKGCVVLLKGTTSPSETGG